MTGTIYLGGGGSAQQEAAVWDAMLRSRPRVLYWPFALGGDMLTNAEGWLSDSLAAHQPGLDLVTWTSLNGHHAEEMAGFDLLFVGGGNTFDLLAHLHRHDATGWAADFTAAGGAFYGGSAGAILSGQTISIASWYDPNETGLADHDGLALVPGVAVLPHYEVGQQQRAQVWSAEHDLAVLGVPETAGCMVANGQLQVLGTDPVWWVCSERVEQLDPGRVVSTANQPWGSTQDPQ